MEGSQTSPSAATGWRGKTALGYLLMIGAAVGVFLLIRWYGLGLHAPDGPGTFVAKAPKAGADTLMHVRLPLFRALVSGYLETAAGVLNSTERAHLGFDVFGVADA